MPDYDIIDLNALLSGNCIENMQLPSPDLLNYYHLAKNRIYYVDAEIDSETMAIQQSIILHNIEDKGKTVNERKPIKLLINSPGGYLTETVALCQTIAASKTPVYTINAGDCSSGAALLLIAGHKRYALKYSTALIHSGSGGTQGTFEQTKEQQKHYENCVNRMGKFILERTKIDEKTWKKNKSKEWYLSDEDQIAYGVVDSLIESLDDIL